MLVQSSSSHSAECSSVLAVRSSSGQTQVTSRILARYRAYHVTYQLNISSIKLRLLLISSNIELTFLTHRKLQICGGNIKLIGHVQGSRDFDNVHGFYLCYLSSACPGSHVPLYRVTLGADINYSALLMPPPLMYSMM